MSIPQNSYAQLARRQVTQAREAAQEHERNEAERHAAINEANGDTPSQRVARAKARRAELFESLKAGDSLERFGLCATVARKNRKSVTTDMGVRWTRKDLGAE